MITRIIYLYASSAPSHKHFLALKRAFFFFSFKPWAYSLIFLLSLPSSFSEWTLLFSASPLSVSMAWLLFSETWSSEQIS